MKLISFEIIKRGDNGLSFNSTSFGKRITQLLAENETGKTPVIQSIVYSLGVTSKFRNLIQDKCFKTRLKIEHENIIYTIERYFQKEFRTDVTSVGIDESFYSEHDFSKFMFSLFNIEILDLVSVGNEKTSPYLSTLLPMFYLNQDLGYQKIYSCNSNFIKNQHAEMIRLAFGLPAKNDFNSKSKLLESKKNLELLNKGIVTIKGLLDKLNEENKNPLDTVCVLDEKISKLNLAYNEIKEKTERGFPQPELNVIQSNLNDKLLEKGVFQSEIDFIKVRVKGFKSLMAGVDTEIKALHLNEASKRMFDSFSEICSNDNCGLFTVSKESYGKSLLYLKDQLKDLEYSINFDLREIEKLKAGVESVEKDINKLQNYLTKIKNESKSGMSGIFDQINEIVREKFELERRKANLNQINKLQSEYLDKINNRDRLMDKIASLSGKSNQFNISLSKLRNEIKDGLRKWLDIIGARKVEGNIEISSDFIPTFGGEKLSQFSGSTLARIVLAYNTAIFEQYIKNKDAPFRFLILDTPRQNELNIGHFDNYMTKVSSLVGKFDAQIVFSTTDYKFDIDKKTDVNWCPEHIIDGVKMYLYSNDTE